MTELSLKNPIAIAMISIAVSVFAVVVTPRMAVDTFPDLTPPVLVIGTSAPGLGAKDVEKTLTWRFEKYVSATPGVDHVESTSRNGLSVVFVWLKWGTNLDAAQTLVQQQVQFAMAAVPKSLGVIPPFVLQYDPSNAPVVQVAVYGGGMTGPQLYDYALNNIEPRLESISGVASASVNGGRQRQINVVVDPVKAEARGLTSDDVAEAVAKANALLPSGELIQPRFDAIVYTNAIAKVIKNIGNAIVERVGGRAVRIHDVAKVIDGASPATQDVSINGQNGVYLNVLRVPGGNTLAIVDQVKDVIAHLDNLPPKLHVEPIFDQSTFVRSSYHGLQKEIIQALILVALVILVFLQSMRGTLIVSLAIPLSFAITLIVLYADGQTLNVFTLGGLTLAMGRLVDNAVVVLESIHRYRKKGLSSYQAALQGTKIVVLPVLASTLTTIAVLLPVLLFAGLAQKLFVPLALTVAVSMIASYFVSVAVTPVACHKLLDHEDEPGRFGRALERFIAWTADIYARSLRVMLPYGWGIILASVLMVIASGWVAGRLPSQFFPSIDESMERVYVRLAPGTSIMDASHELEDMAQTLQEELPKGLVKLVLTNTGSPMSARSAMNSPNWGPHMGFIRLQLCDPDKRSISQEALSYKIRAILDKRYPGVETLQWPGGLVASVFSNGFLAPLAVEIRTDNLVKLKAEEDAVAEVARTVPGIRDVWPTLELDYPEVHIDTDREEAGQVGVTARAAAQTALESTFGNINKPSVWVDPSNGVSYYLVTYYDPKKLTDPRELATAPIRIHDGAAITLGSYGLVHRETGPIAVERDHMARAAHVLMQVEGRDLGSTASDLEAALKRDPRTAGLKVEFVGQVELMRTTFSGLGLAIGLAVMVVFMIMAAQFKSLRLPLIMLFTIPCTLIGIVLALLAGGLGFSVTALMGVLMVVGIAVSNGILLIDHARIMLDEGMSKVEAIVDAARTRFVPIAMTTLATVIGLVPTAIGFDRSAEANRPLALAVVGGLTSSTVLSLYLVPVIFLLLAKRSPPLDES